MSQDQNDYQPFPTVAEMFGEDLGPDPFADAALVPDKRSSAARHAGRVKDRELAAIERRDLAQLGTAAAEQGEDEALERAQGLIRAGRKVPTATRVQAMAALRRRGTPVPSADLLAARRGADHHAAPGTPQGQYAPAQGQGQPAGPTEGPAPDPAQA